VSQQDSLEFGRWYLKSLVLDQFLRAVNDKKMMIVIGVPDVASMQPTLGVDGPSRRLRPIQITFHYLWTTDTNLTLLVRSQWRPGLQMNNFALGVRRTDTHRAELNLRRIRGR
jgi:hypothetical protein